MLLDRVANLAGRVTIIEVRGSTSTEIADARYRVESALRASAVARKGGAVAGGGVALLRAKRAVEVLQSTNEAERAGHLIVGAMLEEPMRLSARTSRLDEAEILDQISVATNPNHGLNVDTGCIEDLTAAGVLDAAEIVDKAMELAVAHARSVLSTGTWDEADLTSADEESR